MAPTTHIPFAYQLGPLEITGFGLGMLLAFVIGQIVATAVLERRGLRIAELALSEIAKADGSLTCMSILLD